MARVLRRERRTCPHCGFSYRKNIYYENSASICPKCRKRDDVTTTKNSVSKFKSPQLKECQNPTCDDGNGLPYLFWGYRNQKYCSDHCVMEVRRERQKKNIQMWREKKKLERLKDDI